jgi:hypothetical protein
MDLREIGWEGADCMHLAEDRDLWQALVNMAFGFHKRQRISLVE